MRELTMGLSTNRKWLFHHTHMLHVKYIYLHLSHKNGVNVGELSSSMEHMGILGDGHLSFHRALHTNYARISRRMKHVVAQMDGPWPISQIPIDLGLFGR